MKTDPAAALPPGARQLKSGRIKYPKPSQLTIVSKQTARRLGYLAKKRLVDMAETRHILARPTSGAPRGPVPRIGV